jgi:predicted aspartyl protease
MKPFVQIGAVAVIALSAAAMSAPLASAAEVPTGDPSATDAPTTDALESASPALEQADSVAPSPIPVHNRMQGESGLFEPTVEVVIGGATLTVMLDTGSSGLWINDETLDEMTTQPVETGIPMTVSFNPGDITGQLELAPVTIGDYTTPAPVPLFVAETCDFDCRYGDLDLDGILGTKQGMQKFESADASYEYYSPLAQLGGEAAKGHTLKLGLETGVMELGKPVDRSGMVLQAGEGSGTYPNGQRMFGKGFPLCWSIDDQENCASAVFDSGEYSADIMGTQFEPWATLYSEPFPLPAVGVFELGVINPGTVVSYSQAAGDKPFASVVAGSSNSRQQVGLWSHPSGEEYMNSGNSFFLGRSMGFDNETGELIIGDSKSVPGVAKEVSAHSTDRGIEVRWAAPDSSGDGRVTSYVVSLLNLDGKTLKKTTVGAEESSRVIEVTDAHDKYRIAVAAANEYGVGPDTEAAGVIVPEHKDDSGHGRLADTGSEPVAGLFVGASALLAGMLVIVARARRRSVSRE